MNSLFNMKLFNLRRARFDSRYAYRIFLSVCVYSAGDIRILKKLEDACMCSIYKIKITITN